MDRCKISKWEIVLYGPDKVNIPSLPHARQRPRSNRCKEISESKQSHKEYTLLPIAYVFDSSNVVHEARYGHYTFKWVIL